MGRAGPAARAPRHGVCRALWLLRGGGVCGRETLGRPTGSPAARRGRQPRVRVLGTEGLACLQWTDPLLHAGSKSTQGNKEIHAPWLHGLANGARGVRNTNLGVALGGHSTFLGLSSLSCKMRVLTEGSQVPDGSEPEGQPQQVRGGEGGRVGPRPRPHMPLFSPRDSEGQVQGPPLLQLPCARRCWTLKRSDL